ncbi:hypothetical protein CK203_077488 [Vitis vinifera]|uniref:Uncharacterized protein n=1 Tax=Vitis vinifera TaxID=29760 RepID=A0A438DT90_VITVI|nr:hypothetical protein CK203_077488 [Vitis vinifera]
MSKTSEATNILAVQPIEVFPNQSNGEFQNIHAIVVQKMKSKVERIFVEKKNFQVEFEGLNGGTWVSVTERSRGFVVSIGFDMEELDWLMVHLKKAVEVEASRGFVRKIRGKTKTLLMEICFNNRGRFMKITEFVTKRKPLFLVVPEGVKGKGWEDLRKAILLVQENSERDGGASKEKNGDIRMNRDTFRGGRSYAEVVAEAGLRTGGSFSAGKWARAVICESQEKVQDWTHEGRAIARMMGMKGMVSINPISAFKGCFFVSSTRRAERVHDQGRLSVKGRTILLRKWSPKENMVVQGKFRRGWLVLKGLPFHLWDEVQLNFILKKWGRVTKVAKETLKLVDLTRAKLWVEMLPNVVLPALLEVEDGERSYTVAVSVTGEDEDADAVTSELNRSRNEWVRVGGCVSQSSKLQKGYEVVLGTSSATERGVFPGHVIGNQEAIATLCPEDARAGAEVFLREEGRAVEIKAQSLLNPRPSSDNIMGCKFKGPSGLGQSLGGTKPSSMEVWSRREAIEARKGKAPAVHMRDATQEEETAITKKTWSTLFSPSADRRQGHRCCSEPIFTRGSSSSSEGRNMEEEFGMGSQMERGTRVNPLSRCPLGCGYSVMGSPSNPIIRGKGLIFEGFCKIPGAKILESPLSQSPTEDQGISKFFYEKGGVDYLNHGDIPVRVEGENQCALSNQITESCTPKDSIVRSHKEVSGDFLIDGLSPGKMAKVREVLGSLDIKVYSRRKSRGPSGH